MTAEHDYLSMQAQTADKAIETVHAHLTVGIAVIATRGDDPAAVPEYGETATFEGISRRIVAALLNDGWIPPGRATQIDQARGIALRLLATVEAAGVDLQGVDRHLARAISEDPALFWLRGEERPPGEWRGPSGKAP